jgi:hypothetical protein
MPSPFDRSNLKDHIKTKQNCSPLDLAKLPKECDQLLNLQPIIHKKHEEIDCGDLFGSKYLFQRIFVLDFRLIAGSTFDITAQLPNECDQLSNIHQKDEEIDCGDLFGSKYLF